MSRVDAIPKVLGKKVFVRDLRALDIKNLPGTEEEDWGNVTWHALLLRASYLQRAVDGIHLPTLSKYRVSKCFVRDGDEFINSLDTNERYTLNFEYALFGSEPKVDLFISIDESASYVGQPVALLLFDDIANFLNAEREQLGIRDLILYGPYAYDTKPKAFEESNPIDTALDHWVTHGIIPEDAFLYGGQGVAVGKLSGARFSTIEKSLHAGNTVQLRTSTQMVDPAFLEPDASLGKVEKLPDGKYSLTMYAPTQSPKTDEAGINVALGSNITASKIDLRTLMLGGGFGGRDFSTFPIYGAVAALVGQGKPVRLVLDRYSQFVSGTKRHASTMQTEVAYAHDGHLLALKSKLLLDGGSQKDLTTSVRGLALHSATGAYRYDHWDLRSLSMRNSGPLAGSMRGFGIPQVLFNVEQVIDQIAFELRQDPIEYRKGKVLNTGDLDAHKQILYHDIRNAEILAGRREPTTLDRAKPGTVHLP